MLSLVCRNVLRKSSATRPLWNIAPVGWRRLVNIAPKTVGFMIDISILFVEVVNQLSYLNYGVAHCA